jgi:hypothetical protein
MSNQLAFTCGNCGPVRVATLWHEDVLYAVRATDVVSIDPPLPLETLLHSNMECECGCECFMDDPALHYVLDDKYDKYSSRKDEQFTEHITKAVFDQPIPTFGDRMKIESFLSLVSVGALIDSDGHGNLICGDKLSNVVVLPSHAEQLSELMELLPVGSEVLWFNK